MDKKLKILGPVLFVFISLFNANAQEIQDSNALDSLPVYSIYLQKPLNGNIYADTHGVALTDSIIRLDSASVLSLTAIPDSGFQFVQWHDLDTHAIRTISIIKDTLLAALFDSIHIYEPIFGKESTVYNYTYIGYDYIGTYTASYLKDTLIMNKYYKVFNIPRHGITHIIRANENNSIVYQWVKTEEYVVMNLNMKIGDSLSIFRYHKEMIIVDSVYLLDGRKHIRFIEDEIIPWPHNLVFIEGIGSTNTLFYQSSQWKWQTFAPSVLLCISKDNEQTYTNPDPMFEEKCYYSWMNIEGEIKKTTLNISPNPASTQLNIEIPQIPNGNKKEVAIYDMQGRKKLKQIFTENSLSLDISAFSKGLYILQITDLSTHAKIQQKWIKN